MAKVGEGDPRWIVEARSDGANVGGWHWAEHSVQKWAVDTLKARLEAIGDELADNASVAKVRDVKGDATVNRRKGKTMFLYDLSATIEWEYDEEDSDEDAVKGKMLLSDIEQENDRDEFDCVVRVDGAETKHIRKVKEIVRDAGVKRVRKAVGAFVDELREHARVVGETKFAASARSGSTDEPRRKVKLDEVNAESEAEKKKKAEAARRKAAEDRTTLRLQRRFRARPEDVFACFVDMRRACAWTQSGSTRVSAESGGEFVLFDGAITGRNKSVEAPKKIVQEWRLSSWAQGHMSEVTITVSWDDDNNESVVKLVQKHIPSSDMDMTRQGWEGRIFAAIKRTFGF